ncbi:MAG: hypothetical protein HZR80_07030 [Candidatus Heimdallarchaeota archaeon]
MSKLFDEGHDIFYAFNHGYLNKESIAFMCYLLVTNSLKSSNLEYLSLKHLKEIISNHFSKRSVDSFVKILIQLEILQKLPRKKQQSYRLQLNHPLLRFLITIYFPDFQFFASKNKPRKSNLSKLIIFKNQLESSIYPLLDKESYTASTSEDLLVIIDSSKSVDEIKEKMFRELVNKNTSNKVMEILAEIMQNELESS